MKEDRRKIHVKEKRERKTERNKNKSIEGGLIKIKIEFMRKNESR